MPHDCKGQQINVGDTLVLRCCVKSVHLSETACNVDVYAKPNVAAKAEYLPAITCDSRLFEVAPEQFRRDPGVFLRGDIVAKPDGSHWTEIGVVLGDHTYGPFVEVTPLCSIKLHDTGHKAYPRLEEDGSTNPTQKWDALSLVLIRTALRGATT